MVGGNQQQQNQIIKTTVKQNLTS